MANTPSNRQYQQYERKSKATRSIEHEHAKIHDENAYTFSVQTSLTNAGSFSILLSTPTSYFPHYRTITLNPEDGPIRYRMYRAPFIDNNSLGTAITIHNMDFASSNTSSLAVYTNPFTDVASLGIVIPLDELIPSAGVQGGGQLTPTPFEFILNDNENVLIRFDNQAGAATQLTYKAFFYETTTE
jgi:hypothetical protein